MKTFLKIIRKFNGNNVKSAPEFRGGVQIFPEANFVEWDQCKNEWNVPDTCKCNDSGAHAVHILFFLH